VHFSRLATPGDHAKKKTPTSAAQQDPKVQEERQRWRRRTARIDPARFKFLDQTNAKTTFTRLYGRAPRGQRVREFVPDGRWYSLTLMGTLGWEGDTTAFTYEGGTDVMAMLTFVKELLAPQLRPRHILVLDRLSSHLDATVIAEIEKTGAAVWHLPPYSHDLNPIEHMWSKIKAYLRKEKPRDTAGLIAAIGNALRTVTPTDAIHWFAHCGYPHTKT
jgi:transposase